METEFAECMGSHFVQCLTALYADSFPIHFGGHQAPLLGEEETSRIDIWCVAILLRTCRFGRSQIVMGGLLQSGDVLVAYNRTNFRDQTRR